MTRSTLTAAQRIASGDNEAMSTVTEQQVGEFQRDGVAVPRGILTDREVATLERGVERNLADLSPLFPVLWRS